MENKTIGITALLIMLAGTGSYIGYQNIDFSKPVYYCESRIDLGPQYCTRFSTSGVRCYPNLEDNKGYKDCSIGWTEIKNIEEIPIINAPTDEQPIFNSKEIICSPAPNYGCREK
jgi:hypothetical protein